MPELQDILKMAVLGMGIAVIILGIMTIGMVLDTNESVSLITLISLIIFISTSSIH